MSDWGRLPKVMGENKEKRQKEISKLKEDKQKEREKAIKKSSKQVIERKRGDGDDSRRIFV